MMIRLGCSTASWFKIWCQPLMLAVGLSAAERYDANMVPAIFEPFAHGLIDAACLVDGERVLDVACDSGIVARVAEGSAGSVVGVDLNEDMLTVARRHAEGIVWKRGDVTAMAFGDDSFDVVLCQDGVQYFADRHTALSEMRRVLTPSGRLVFSVWRGVEFNPTHLVFSQVLDRLVSSEAGDTRRAPFAFSDREANRAAVLEAGFTDPVVRLDVRVARFESAAKMVQIMVEGTPLGAAMADAGEGVLEAVIAEVTDGLAGYVDDYGLAVPLQSWVITATP